MDSQLDWLQRESSCSKNWPTVDERQRHSFEVSSSLNWTLPMQIHTQLDPMHRVFLVFGILTLHPFDFSFSLSTATVYGQTEREPAPRIGRLLHRRRCRMAEDRWKTKTLFWDFLLTKLNPASCRRISCREKEGLLLELAGSFIKGGVVCHFCWQLLHHSFDHFDQMGYNNNNTAS